MCSLVQTVPSPLHSLHSIYRCIKRHMDMPKLKTCLHKLHQNCTTSCLLEFLHKVFHHGLVWDCRIAFRVTLHQLRK